jgi:hypothetical protein
MSISQKVIFTLYLSVCVLGLTFFLHQGLVQRNDPALLPQAGNDALGQLLARIQAEGGEYATGIYAPGTFAFPIVNQPENQDLYVSAKRDLVTLYRAAEKNGVTGLLAHNFLAGALFYNLEIGEEVWLVEDEQTMHGYRVTAIDEFQKIENGLNDTFIDLGTQKPMSSSEMFDRFYTGEPHLILQTCLEEDGDPSWGLTFIVAEPIQ